MGTMYEGFEIFVSAILGSGQEMYQVRGIDYDYGRRGGVTLISDAKAIIDKYLDQYVAPIAQPKTVMSQEMLDQLNAGTVAIWENKTLQNTVDQLKEGLNVISEDIVNFDLSGVQALGDKVQDATSQVVDLGLSLDEQKALITDTLRNEFQALEEKFSIITTGVTGATEDVKDYTADIQGIGTILEGVIDNINASKAGFEEALKILGDKLKAEQQGGWLKMIPLYVGAGLAVIVGIKVLDVMD